MTPRPNMTPQRLKWLEEIERSPNGLVLAYKQVATDCRKLGWTEGVKEQIGREVFYRGDRLTDAGRQALRVYREGKS